MRHLFAAFLLLGSFCSQAYAKAYIQSKAEIIAKAEAIAIIRIDSVRDTEIQEHTWPYLQVASASVMNL